MSGTSLDGVDAALVRIHRAGDESAVELKRFVSLPYPGDVRDALLRVASGRPVPAGVVSQLSVLLGGLYAQAVKEVCRVSGISPGQLDLIGSHGQTIYHQSAPSDLCGFQIASTYQIGEASVLVEETGVTTVSDFRHNDMAAGGTGAPLIPLVDFLLFRDPKLGRVLLNVGGIANLTVLPSAAELDKIQAFDSGPGNMVIDALVRRLIEGEEVFDSEGGIASSGKPIASLLEALLTDPYFSRPPPKSAGREQFGEEFVERMLAAAGTANTADLICTATELTVRTVSDAVTRCAADATRFDQMVVSGGGVHNAYLMRRLKESLPHIDVIAADELGIPVDAKEAVGFAVLANETFELAAGNVPAATGARRRVVLGKVTYGRNYGALRGYS